MLEIEKLGEKRESDPWEWERASHWAGQELEVLRHTDTISCDTFLPVWLFKTPNGAEIALDLAWFFEFEE